MTGGALIAACLWVLAATAIAFLPIRRQYLPGLILLAGAVPLLVWLGQGYGPWVVLAALAALISMFRRPLWYLGRRLLGRVPPPVEGDK
jgi:hypothetical protein